MVFQTLVKFGTFWPKILVKNSRFSTSENSNQGWVWNNGSCCLSYFRHPSWLGNVIGGWCKCFQHHLLNSHLLWTSHDKKPIVSTFSFYLAFFCPTCSPLFQPPFPFKADVHHPFFNGHMLGWIACHAFFFTSPFLGVMMFYRGFFLFVFSHPLLVMPLSFLLVWNIFF